MGEGLILFTCGTGLVLRRPGAGEMPVGMVGEGQLGVNVLAMADVLADDSSTRKAAMESLARPMVDALTVSPSAFADRWCGGMWHAKSNGCPHGLTLCFC